MRLDGSWKSMEASEEQDWKAYSPIQLTFDGSVIDASELQL